MLETALTIHFICGIFNSSPPPLQPLQSPVETEFNGPGAEFSTTGTVQFAHHDRAHDHVGISSYSTSNVGSWTTNGR